MEKPSSFCLGNRSDGFSFYSESASDRVANKFGSWRNHLSPVSAVGAEWCGRQVAPDGRRNDATSGPYTCEVEIRSDGLWLRQMNKQIIHEWPSLEAVEETADSVDLFTRDGAGVVVRNRAFASGDERSKFIALARSHLIQARS